ncbi:recombinase family protein [Desulfobacterota bacterium AH_259_B03_O07]|nr:recombinase family protein [Desulfobacterota bacterium AH_259_B03_O07]
MTEPFDTSTPIGEFMFTQLASIAKLERDNIRERSIAGTNRLAVQGKWLGGIVPYGYKLNKESYLEINEDLLLKLNMSEAEVVRMVFNWIGNDSLSTLEVAKRFNAMNVPSHYAKDGREFSIPPQNQRGSAVGSGLSGKRKVKTSGRWHPHRIGNLVHNTTYKGIHQYGKRSKKPRKIIEREVPAIVSPDLWNKAQEVLKNNLLWANRNTTREYLLRGLIKCGICGRNLTGSFYKNKKKENAKWYRCNGKLQHVQEGTGEGPCECKSIKSEWVENLVWREIKDWILHPESLECILTRKIKENDKEKGTYFGKLKNIKADIQNKEEEKEKIIRLYRTSLITMSDVEKQLEEIEKDKAELELMMSELKTNIMGEYSDKEIIKEIKTRLDQFKDIIENDNITWQQKRRIVETFVKEVQVNITKDKKPLIMIDTIPIRKNLEATAPKSKFKITNLYTRVSNSKKLGKSEEIKADTINIAYKFPLPSSEIYSIADHTGKGSLPPPT